MAGDWGWESKGGGDGGGGGSLLIGMLFPTPRMLKFKTKISILAEFLTKNFFVYLFSHLYSICLNFLFQSNSTNLMFIFPQ